MPLGGLVVAETGTRVGGLFLGGRGSVSLGGLLVDLKGKLCLGSSPGVVCAPCVTLGGPVFLSVNLGGRVLRESVFLGSCFAVVRIGTVVLWRLSSRFGVVFAVRTGVEVL